MNIEDLSFLGEKQKILIKGLTHSNDGTPPFGFLNIFACVENREFKNITVDLKIVAKGPEAESYTDHPVSFDIPYDDISNLGAVLLSQQIAVLNFAHNAGTVSDKEIEALQNFTASKNSESPFITEGYMVQKLGSDYMLNENMVQATHMIFHEVLDELNLIFSKLKKNNDKPVRTKADIISQLSMCTAVMCEHTAYQFLSDLVDAGMEYPDAETRVLGHFTGVDNEQLSAMYDAQI